MTAIAHLIKPKPKINWLKNRLAIDYFWKIVLRRVIQITQSLLLQIVSKPLTISKIGEEAGFSLHSLFPRLPLLLRGMHLVSEEIEVESHQPIKIL